MRLSRLNVYSPLKGFAFALKKSALSSMYLFTAVHSFFAR